MVRQGSAKPSFVGSIPTVASINHAISLAFLTCFYNGQVLSAIQDTPRFASLFSGCGGFDLGFLHSGFRPVAAFDVDAAALSSYEHNIAKVSEVRDLSTPAEFPSRAYNVDVLLAGPPCQGFSTAGKRRVDDPRNHFVPLAAELATLLRPKVFVLENVPAARTGGHGKYWQAAHECLSSGGFRTREFVCHADRSGLPQVRKRLLLIAWRTDAEFYMEHLGEKASSLADALKDVESLPDHYPVRPPADSVVTAIAAHIGPGQKLSNVRAGPNAVHTWEIPSVFGRTTAEERALLTFLLRERRRNRRRNWGDADPVPPDRLQSKWGSAYLDIARSLLGKGYIRKVGDNWDLTRTFNGKYKRLQWNEPAPTVHTRFGDPRYFLHPAETRGFSVREAARLQGFPDDYEFSGRRQDQYRQIGNAVPPPAAAWIARSVRRSLLQ